MEMRDHTQGEWKERPSAAPSISHSPEMRPLEAGWGSSTTGGCGGVATRQGPGPTRTGAGGTLIHTPGLVGVSHEIGLGAQGDSCGATEVRSPWTWRGGAPHCSRAMVGHFLLQGIFLTQGSNPGLLCQQADSLSLSHLGSLAQRKRASPRGEAGTSGFLCVSDSDRRVPAELGQEPLP